MGGVHDIPDIVRLVRHALLIFSQEETNSCKAANSCKFLQTANRHFLTKLLIDICRRLQIVEIAWHRSNTVDPGGPQAKLLPFDEWCV